MEHPNTWSLHHPYGEELLEVSSPVMKWNYDMDLIRKSRYEARLIPGTKKWGVWDGEYQSFCTLPDKPWDGSKEEEAPNLLPLEWNRRAGAQAWIFRCRLAWGSGSVPAPRNWAPVYVEPKRTAGKRRQSS